MNYQHRTIPGAPGGALLFLFHGTGGDEHQLLPLGRTVMPEATFVSLRGDVSERGALRFFRRRAEGDYDMEDLAERTAAVAEFLEAQVAEHDPGRVAGLGYSNGANILASVLFARPGLFTDAVLMHPLIPWDPAPAPTQTRILITAGRRDPICPPDLTERLAHWFEQQGAPVEVHWHPGGHELAGSEIAVTESFLR